MSNDLERYSDPDNATVALFLLENDMDELTDILVAALDAVGAPTTTNNFVFLARDGFYDGTRFQAARFARPVQHLADDGMQLPRRLGRADDEIVGDERDRADVQDHQVIHQLIAHRIEREPGEGRCGIRGELDGAAAEPHEPLPLELLQEPAHHLAGGAELLGDRLVDRLERLGGRVTHEFLQSQVEIGTGVCATIGEAPPWKRCGARVS